MRFDCVIWDWNGTLLSDVAENIETINTLLRRRGIPVIADEESYLARFSIPVREYYLELGFDLVGESFHDIAEEYITEYNKRIVRCGLYDGAAEVLRGLSEAGVRQYIVSSAEDTRLRGEVESFGIAELFDGIYGNRNNLGGGKVAVAESLIAACGIPAERVLFVGDLTHDAEVAESVGCPCALIPKGHQSRARLAETDAAIIDDIKNILRYVTEE